MQSPHPEFQRRRYRSRSPEIQILYRLPIKFDIIIKIDIPGIRQGPVKNDVVIMIPLTPGKTSLIDGDAH